MDLLSWSLISLGALLIVLEAKDAWDWRWVRRELNRQYREEQWRQFAAQRWGRE